MKEWVARRLNGCVVAVSLLGGIAVADKILVINADTLTDYVGGTTRVQDVQPRPEQRAIDVDGRQRSDVALGMAVAGNPFEDLWSGAALKDGVRLHSGTWETLAIDLSLPAPGFRWKIGRTFNARQGSTGQHDSNGYQGRNWFQTSQPELVLQPGPEATRDVLYLVIGADRYLEFQRKLTGDQFRGKNGVAGVFDHQQSQTEPDLYVLTDNMGVDYTFFADDATNHRAEWQLWKVEDGAGNRAYVGHPTNATAATTSGYDTSGRIVAAYDSADRRYTYNYETYDGVDRLESVVVETETSGNWSSPIGVQEVSRVEYTYYGDENYGEVGDLKTVKRTAPLSDVGLNDVGTTYYRYWEGAFDGSSNPGNPGHPHTLKLVLEEEGTRGFDWNESGSGSPGVLDQGYLGATNQDLEPYAAAYFEYDSSRRVQKAWFNGNCGCSGASTGTHVYHYEANAAYTDGTGYDSAWEARTIVEEPDGSWVTQYFDETGQPLAHVVTDEDPAITNPTPDTWANWITRDGEGRVIEHATPSSVASYGHAAGTATLHPSKGLIWHYQRLSSGATTSFTTGTMRSKGSSGDKEYIELIEWTSSDLQIGDATVMRPRVSRKEKFSDRILVPLWSDYSEWGGTPYSPGGNTLVNEVAESKAVAVSGGNNGSGIALTTYYHHTPDGRVDMVKTPDGTVTYRGHNATGQVSLKIADADTTQTGPGEDLEGVTVHTTFQTTGSRIHYRTSYSYDPQGRTTRIELPSGRVVYKYYSKLADGRRVTLVYPRFEAPNKFWGPVRMTVWNGAGNVAARGVIGVAGGSTTVALENHVDEGDSDPLTAFSGLGTLNELVINTRDGAGEAIEEQRLYFDMPSSGQGTSGVNYDKREYQYNESGLRERYVTPAGTIVRLVRDARGRETEKWVGTNDSSFPGGSTSGQDDMTRVWLKEYDLGVPGGNGRLTKFSRFEDTQGLVSRDTEYAYSWRGWKTLVTEAEPPHRVYAYDNLGREVARAYYKSSNSLVPSTNPALAHSDRIAYETISRDERGRVWKRTRHEIDPANGSSVDSLEEEQWYDKMGRIAKSDGWRLRKARYDSIGRETHAYTLAKDDDSSYSDVLNLSGDTVLEEDHHVHDVGGRVVGRVWINRNDDDIGSGRTLGGLDLNTDADPLVYTANDLQGRVRIDALFYDELDRIEDRVQYGTVGGNNFTYTQLTAPARSDTELRSTVTYDDYGRIQTRTDPRGIEHREYYDDAGRPTKTIRNYVDGIPATNGTDNEEITLTEYQDGLPSEVKISTAEGDRVSEYKYGVQKGVAAGDSQIASSDLLREIVYPDSSGASDVESYAYNVQGDITYRKDQNGTILLFEYDGLGRRINTVVDNFGAGTDDSVGRIELVYDAFGSPSVYRQYDLPGSVGATVVDELSLSRNGWGLLDSVECDFNSEIASSGGDSHEFSYAYSKKTTGRNTIRRDSLTYPDGTVIDYKYLSTGGLLDNACSRVTQVKAGANRLATYTYAGETWLTGLTLDQVDMSAGVSTAGLQGFEGFDRFNRRTTRRWEKDVGGGLVVLERLSELDRNSNLSSTEQSPHSGYDALFEYDQLNRLESAEEGSVSGGVLVSTAREYRWTMDQAGNWLSHKFDGNGDGDYTDTEDLDESRVHGDANELESRDVDGVGGVDFQLSYDLVGNLIDDGEHYTYKWDAFNRLKQVRRRSDQLLVAEYAYDGRGQRISTHVETDGNPGLTTADDWLYTVYDDKWRALSQYRESDSDPKIRYVYHMAGFGEQEAFLSEASIMLRDRDANTPAGQPSDGVLEERMYYCTNADGSTAAMVSSAGVEEYVQYSPYGDPICLPAGDADSDGDCDQDDLDIIEDWDEAEFYDVRGDVNLDGRVNQADRTRVSSDLLGQTGGRGVLSTGRVENSLGFLGHQWDPAVSLYNARARWLAPVLGRWMSRDPSGYVDGLNLYQYAQSMPTGYADYSGHSAERKDYWNTPINTRYSPGLRLGFYALGNPAAAAKLAKSRAVAKGKAAGNRHKHAGGQHANAMRHCTASCVSAQAAGPEAAWNAGAVNELYKPGNWHMAPGSNGGPPSRVPNADVHGAPGSHVTGPPGNRVAPNDMAADLHNNHVGIDCASRIEGGETFTPSGTGSDPVVCDEAEGDSEDDGGTEDGEGSDSSTDSSASGDYSNVDSGIGGDGPDGGQCESCCEASDELASVATNTGEAGATGQDAGGGAGCAEEEEE